MILRSWLFVIVMRPLCPRTDLSSLPELLRLIDATSNDGAWACGRPATMPMIPTTNNILFISVLGGRLRGIDHEHINRAALRVEFQPELFLHRRHKRRTVGVVPLQLEVEDSGQAGFVHDHSIGH